MTISEAEQAVIEMAVLWHQGEVGNKMLREKVDALLALRSSDAGGDCANCGHGADYHANTWCGWLDKADRQCGCLEFEPVPEQAKAEESDAPR